MILHTIIKTGESWTVARDGHHGLIAVMDCQTPERAAAEANRLQQAYMERERQAAVYASAGLSKRRSVRWFPDDQFA